MLLSREYTAKKFKNGLLLSDVWIQTSKCLFIFNIISFKSNKHSVVNHTQTLNNTFHFSINSLLLIKYVTVTAKQNIQDCFPFL
jgi:hypothetical protein